MDRRQRAERAWKCDARAHGHAVSRRTGDVHSTYEYPVSVHCKFLGRTLAFVVLERSGGVLVYDVTSPEAPAFQQYIYLNDHVSPEAMAYVSSAESPNGSPMLIVANEVSGTVAILQPTL